MSASYASIAAGQGSQNHARHPPASQNRQSSPSINPQNVNPKPLAEDKHHQPQTRTYQPNPTQQPQTGQDESSSYVLTLHTSPGLYEAVNSLRRKYFPTRLSKVPAHITLFHALPGSKLDNIRKDLETLTAASTPFNVITGSTKRLRRGVAILTRGSNPAKELHAELKEKWYPWLSQQDRGGFQAHYTVMNKVDDEQTIQDALQEIEQEFHGAKGEVSGVTLWGYDRGFWRFFETHKFSGTPAQTKQ